jgi:hypothetical protein
MLSNRGDYRLSTSSYNRGRAILENLLRSHNKRRDMVSKKRSSKGHGKKSSGPVAHDHSGRHTHHRGRVKRKVKRKTKFDKLEDKIALIDDVTMSKFTYRRNNFSILNGTNQGDKVNKEMNILENTIMGGLFGRLKFWDPTGTTLSTQYIPKGGSNAIAGVRTQVSYVTSTIEVTNNSLLGCNIRVYCLRRKQRASDKADEDTVLETYEVAGAHPAVTDAYIPDGIGGGSWVTNPTGTQVSQLPGSYVSDSPAFRKAFHILSKQETFLSPGERHTVGMPYGAVKPFGFDHQTFFNEDHYIWYIEAYGQTSIDTAKNGRLGYAKPELLINTHTTIIGKYNNGGPRRDMLVIEDLQGIHHADVAKAVQDQNAEEETG